MVAERHRYLGAGLAVAGVLVPCVAAQDTPAAVAPASAAVPRFDVAPTLAALVRMANGTPIEQRTVATSAWLVLALLANGSTLRAGPARADVREHAKWLIEQQYVTGFAVGDELCSRSEQLLGALAITEVCLGSEYRPFAQSSKLGVENAALAMRVKVPLVSDAEFVLWLLLARSARVGQRDAVAMVQSDTTWTAARSQLVAGKTRLADAALHLDELLQGKLNTPELTIALTWPANPAADPLHTLIGALAVPRLPITEKQRSAQFERLASLVAARATEGEHAGTWAPAGGYDRIVTTAMHAITLALANGKTPLFCAK